MELKSYQKEVIADLARYLELVVELQSPAKAYQALWNEKNVLVGFGGMPDYVNVLPGVPPCLCQSAYWRRQDLYCGQFPADDF